MPDEIRRPANDDAADCAALFDLIDVIALQIAAEEIAASQKPANDNSPLPNDRDESAR